MIFIDYLSYPFLLNDHKMRYSTHYGWDLDLSKNITFPNTRIV